MRGSDRAAVRIEFIGGRDRLDAAMMGRQQADARASAPAWTVRCSSSGHNSATSAGRQGLLPLGPRPGRLTAAQQTRQISVIRHHG